MRALGVVEDEVRELVRRRGLDPDVDGGAIRALIDEVLADYGDRALTSSLPPLADVGVAARSVYDSVAGYGPLQPFFDDPQVEEIWVNGRPTSWFGGSPLWDLPAGRAPGGSDPGV
jgi:pilus assembly protein CpaF